MTQVAEPAPAVAASERTVYPGPPWKTAGDCALVFYLVDAEHVKPFIPFPLELVTPLTGRTVGGYYCGLYNKGLDGEPQQWGEFGLVAGLVRYGKKKGFYISQMLTDNPAAWKGGIEEWGLDKTLAHFQREERGGRREMHVWAGERFQTRVRWNSRTPGVRIARDFGFLTMVNGRVHEFSVRYEGVTGLGTSRVKVDKNSITFPKPAVKIGTSFLRCKSIVINGPVDIDLRGYRP